MKTLNQIEPRTPIGSLPFVISADGSYYLTGNLSVTTGDGITITATNTTLDLNGFTISSSSTTPNGTAINISAVPANLKIYNGTIQGTAKRSGNTFTGGGFAAGVQLATSPGTENILVSRLIVSQIAGVAIDVRNGNSRIESCNVSEVSIGLSARDVSDSMASNCLQNAIASYTATNCRGDSNLGKGITASIIRGCYGYSFTTTGLDGALVSNSIGYSNVGNGLVASKTADYCYGETNAGTYALFASGAACYCSATNNSGGISIKTVLAIGCTTFGGTIDASGKYLGSP